MKKIKINIEDLFELEGSVIYNPDSFKGSDNVIIDSRKVKKGSIFVAIKGDKFDGHDFIPQAVKDGADCVVINEKKLKHFNSLDITFVTVPDTVKAFGEIAAAWRKKGEFKVVSLTGSNGKTTTKDMLKDLLSTKYLVTATTANNNNHIGVPLTILSADEKTEVLLIEHGTNHFGEIKYTADIACPDIALITNVGDSHLEHLRDKYGVLDEKASLFDATEKNNGTVIINNDDRLLKGIKRNYSNTFLFGVKGSPDLKGTIKSFDPEGYPVINIQLDDFEERYTIPLYGTANAKNFLSAMAVCLLLGFKVEELIKAVENVELPSNRLGVKHLENLTLINDTYNSNPESVVNALELCKKIKRFKRKIVILGDMLELGKFSFEKHMALYKAITKYRIDEVYSVGKMMSYLDLKLNELGIKSKHFRLRKSLLKAVKEMDLSESVVLVKGSRGMKMEEFVEIIEKRGG